MTLLGRSPQMRRIRSAFARLAQRETPVLLVGESGVGVEPAARIRPAHRPRLQDRRAGVVRGGRGGTLFLNDVDQLSQAGHAALLHVLETGTVTPYGGTDHVRSSVRIVAATHDVGSVSRRASLSEALSARLSATVLRVPPLRERREDIAVLTRHFVKRRRRQFDFGPRALEPRTVELLTAYDWPGSVRELAHVIERTFALRATDDVQPGELPLVLQR